MRRAPSLVLFFLLGLSGAGLASSVAVHSASWFVSWIDNVEAIAAIAWILHIGIYPLFVPAIICFALLREGVDERRPVPRPLRRCPVWLRWVTGGLLVYSAASMVWIVVVTYTGVRTEDVFITTGGLAGLTAHMMGLYCAYLAIFYSAIKKKREEKKGPSGNR
jgi:hypothetical protein